MKKKFIYSIALCSLVFMGCSEEFIDGENTSVLTAEGISEHSNTYTALLDGSLNGITSLIIEPYGITGDSHDDFGQKGVDIWTDIVCGDVALSASAYGWYNAPANMTATIDYTDDTNSTIWEYYYRIIKIANDVIENSGGNEAEPDTDESKRILGQAKAYRAYAYFNLVQLFQRAYDPDQEVLPFYNIDTYSLAKVEASVIYDQIISDLTHSIELLDGYTRDAKNQMDKSVSQGLLAYTYAAMGNYADAKVLADAVTSVYPLTTTAQLAYPGTGSGFNDISTASWIWGYDLTEDLGHQLIDWWGQMDYFTYSYAWAGDTKSIDDLLYSEISDNDIRKTQFGTGAAPLQPINKFFDPGRSVAGQYIITTDLILMRSEEMYLLSAESSAKTGDESTAKSILLEIMTDRVGSAEASTYVNALSGQALIDAIYLQTRIEMWGEGKSYYAMKRNEATVTRGTNHVYRAGESFAYDSDEISFQIPQVEIDNNPSITSQN
ncbi:RagB/SusD family nutrient uptake outer membrane protein [Winogradskyella psychrotolerans]|uniref:RagB/SusD family nutrient uptake outer membrane protein n=1 Tax=Winogradskyella psychrotolerans TaxID=1344585 RepID=UPI001C06F400|nr:RagB/SusD family nutrient uptake outer membrane protein [Winogradskyella psychrotolerans]MBU2929268.1 RagB/SusD family nutrient uptake outer membrane protein [Winogradskyella psychrotolerans]